MNLIESAASTNSGNSVVISVRNIIEFTKYRKSSYVRATFITKVSFGDGAKVNLEEF